MTQLNRRNLLKVLGVGAASTAAACNTQGPENIFPYVIPDEDFIPGKPIFYASTCAECASACGIVGKNYNGRTIKVEGNGADPVSKGGLCARGQSAIQGTYNVDRIRKHAVAGQPSEDLTALAAWVEGRKGGKVLFVSASQTGSLGLTLTQAAKALNGQYLRYEAAVSDGAIRTARTVTGGMPRVDLSLSDLVVSFDADYLESYGNVVAQTKQFSLAKKSADFKGTIHVSPRFSLTASNADTWVSPRPNAVGATALAVLAAVAKTKGVEAEIAGYLGGLNADQLAADAEVSASRIDAVAKALVEAKNPAVLCGTSEINSDVAHAAVAVLNKILGTKTVTYGDNAAYNGLATTAELRAAVSALGAGDLIVAVDTDLRYLVTADIKAAVVALSANETDTTLKADAVVATRSALESWWDAQPIVGLWKLAQPTMQPLDMDGEGVAVDLGTGVLAVLKALGHDAGVTEAKELVRKNWATLVGGDSEQTWLDALQKGHLLLAAKAAAGTVVVPATSGYATAAKDGLTVEVFTSSKFADGRTTNRVWLHEIPDALTTVVWDAWAEAHPDTIAKLGAKEGDIVAVKTANGTGNFVITPQIGVQKGLIAVPTGFGKQSGFYTKGLGGNAFALLADDGVRTAKAEVSVAEQGDHIYVRVQGHNSQQDRGIAQAVDLQGNDLDKPVFHYDTNQNMYTLHEHPEYRWGMAVDLDACTGCGACIVACDVENNIPIVGIQMDMPMPGQGTMQIGKRLLKQGREMHWMRMERFFETYDTDQPDVRFIPAMCQQCENAPCETVCPVYATMHTPDGINGMIYNRCVGTRYCGNNCPYKQRRLNWLTHDWPEAQKLALNPEVTVRTKGVMEKCNFCIQRVRTATTQSRIEGRRVADGEIVVACQQTCPADALIFGDLKDPNTRVSQAVAAGRSYRVFEELNTRPGVHYRKKIKRTPVIA